MSVFESVLADGTMAARSPERSIRHIPFRWQLKRTLHDARGIRKWSHGLCSRTIKEGCNVGNGSWLCETQPGSVVTSAVCTTARN
jgi:hypothetical protein